MPGIIGGIVSAIVASRGVENFGSNYDNLFVKLAERTASQQAGF
jgi:hypothetical protein